MVGRLVTLSFSVCSVCRTTMTGFFLSMLIVDKGELLNAYDELELDMIVAVAATVFVARNPWFNVEH